MTENAHGEAETTAPCTHLQGFERRARRWVVAWRERERPLGGLRHTLQTLGLLSPGSSTMAASWPTPANRGLQHSSTPATTFALALRKLQTLQTSQRHTNALRSFFQALGGGCKENNREQQLTTRPPGFRNTTRAHTLTAFIDLIRGGARAVYSNGGGAANAQSKHEGGGEG